MELVHAFPSLVAPCPFTSFLAQHERHDQVSDGYQSEQCEPSSVADSPDPCPEERSPVPSPHTRRQHGRLRPDPMSWWESRFRHFPIRGVCSAWLIAGNRLRSQTRSLFHATSEGRMPCSSSVPPPLPSIHCIWDARRSYRYPLKRSMGALGISCRSQFPLLHPILLCGLLNQCRAGSASPLAAVAAPPWQSSADRSTLRFA